MGIKPLRIVPLGGLGEVGKNMMAIEYGENILIIDVGIMFPENDMLGIDYIIPDFNYLLDKKDKVRGIIITHGHEDHTGGIVYLLREIQAPIYATALTRGLVEVKLNRGGMLKAAKINTIQAGESIKLGPFTVEFFHVSHSIPDSVGLGITTPAGLIVHSGDFKFDHTPIDGWPTDFAKLAEFGGRGVLALLADSTNANNPGWTESEKVIEGGFDSVFRNAKGRILIGTFASLISRIAQAAEVAERYGRKMAFVGMSMVENVKMARRLGYLKIPDDMIVSLDQTRSMDPDQVVLMCTGTQGEPSSILGRLSTGTNRNFDLLPSDTVVLSSQPIPGNEEMVYRTINRLLHRGVEVIDENVAPVHVSGHASQEEIKMLIQFVRPKFYIPIHGELRHLKQNARLARELGLAPERIAVVENGTVIEFHNAEMKIGERIPGGYVFIDGSGVGDVGPAVMREREALSRDGFVAVYLNLDPKSGRLVNEPEIVSKGFVFVHEADQLFGDARKRIREVVAKTEKDGMRNRVERDLSKFFYNETRRRPVVIVFA